MEYLALYLFSIILMNFLWVSLGNMKNFSKSEHLWTQFFMLIYPITFIVLGLTVLYIKLEKWNILPKGSN